MSAKLLKSIMIVVSFAVTISANPLSPFEGPGISEVNWTDEQHWSIELDGTYCLDYSMDRKYPYTTDKLSLYILSAKKLYRTKIQFDSALIGVITPSSITGLTGSETVKIKRSDEISIVYDSVWHNQTYSECWRCTIRNITSGHSIVRLGRQYDFMETSRKSIGSRGNYSTKFEFALQDAYHNSLSGMTVYLHYRNGTVMDTALTYYGYGYSGYKKFDTTTYYIINMPITGRAADVYFIDDKAGLTVKSDTLFQPPRCQYIDTVYSVRDTITLPVTSYELTVFDPNQQFIPYLRGFRSYIDKTLTGISPLYVYIQGEYAKDTTIAGEFRHIARFKTFYLRIYQKDSPALFCFKTADDTTKTIGSWTGIYCDTAKMIKDTLIIELKTPSISKSQSQQYLRSGFAFSAIPPHNGYGINFIIGTPAQNSEAAITICRMDGREIASVKSTLAGAGTHTIVWKSPDRRLGAGTYVCVLSINNVLVASRQLTVHK